MASPSEKNSFVSSLYNLHYACSLRANDGYLTSDQRNLFITAVIYFNSDIGKAAGVSFDPIPSNIVSIAMKEIQEAIRATGVAHDDPTVQLAAKELWDAKLAVDNVLC